MSQVLRALPNRVPVPLIKFSCSSNSNLRSSAFAAHRLFLLPWPSLQNAHFSLLPADSQLRNPFSLEAFLLSTLSIHNTCWTGHPPRGFTAYPISSRGLCRLFLRVDCDLLAGRQYLNLLCAFSMVPSKNNTDNKIYNNNSS